MAPDLSPHLIAKHLAKLLAQARTLAHNDADAQDLVQETCVRALTAAARRERPDADQGEWLRVILRNTWLNALRAERVREAAASALIDDADYRLVHTSVTRAQMARVFNRVPRKARGLVLECLVEGEPRASVSARRGLTPAAIDASIYRARRVFREAGLGIERTRGAPHVRRDAADRSVRAAQRKNRAAVRNENRQVRHSTRVS
jgi:RNA polymerase sigma-70 factor (ECF subfamily)